MTRPQPTPETLARAYLLHARNLYLAGKGRVRRCPHPDPVQDPAFVPLVACYHFAQRPEVLPGFTLSDIARYASVSVYNIGPYPPSRLALPLRRAATDANRRRSLELS